jgi:hypothetical protein
MLPHPDADVLGWLRAVDLTGGWVLTKEAAALVGITPGRLCYLRRRGRISHDATLQLSASHILWAVTEVDRLATEGPLNALPEALRASADPNPLKDT